MNKNKAYTIVDNYFKAWLDQNKALFLSLLHNKIIVKECTGDMYKSKSICNDWFDGWHKHNNKVLQWDITQRNYDEEKQTVVVEWLFTCQFEEAVYTFEGCSLIEFKDDLIIGLREYQMDVNKKYPYGK